MGTLHNLFATPAPAIAMHPTFTPAELATMTTSERAFFTDAPTAHEVAYRDFQRDQLRDSRARAFARASDRALTYRRLALGYDS